MGKTTSVTYSLSLRAGCVWKSDCSLGQLFNLTKNSYAFVCVTSPNANLNMNVYVVMLYS